MGRKLLTGTFVLVGLYLVVSRATNTGKLLTSASQGYVRGVRALQGRG